MRWAKHLAMFGVGSLLALSFIIVGIVVVGGGLFLFQTFVG